MSDTANKPWTGPTSKDAHAGGKTLGKKLHNGGFSVGSFTNSPAKAKSAFSKMKFKNGSTAAVSPNVKGAMLNKPKNRQG